MTNTPPYFKRTHNPRSTKASPEAAASPNWWYGTALRYLTGTLMGVLCLCVIGTAFKEINVLELVRSFLNPNAQGNVVVGVCILLSGLLFCYVASSPITIFHSARMFNSKELYCWVTPSRLWAGVWMVGVVLLPLTLAMYSDKLEYIFAIWLAVPAMYVLFFQWFCIRTIQTSTKNGSEVFLNYIKTVSEKRVNYKDYRESYTHLREHSNSIFIVLLEVSLSALLWLVVSTAKGRVPHALLLAIGVIFLWILPNVYLWAFANHLEDKMKSFKS